jgi:hypothetical protein
LYARLIEACSFIEFYPQGVVYLIVQTTPQSGYFCSPLNGSLPAIAASRTEVLGSLCLVKAVNDSLSIEVTRTIGTRHGAQEPCGQRVRAHRVKIDLIFT